MANTAWTTQGRGQYIGRPIVTATLSGADQWTTPSYFALPSEELGIGPVDLSIAGSFVATLTLQRSFDDGTTWYDVETFTEGIQKQIDPGGYSTKWRLGIKAGQYTSGTAAVRLSQA